MDRKALESLPKEALVDLVLQLLERVTALEARLGTNSTNSSQPPSSDRVSPPKRGRKTGGGRVGGQPGHEGTTWQPFRADEVSSFEDLVPAACVHCMVPFAPSALNPRSKPAVFQHVELPPLSLVVTEYRRHARTCACCGKRTRASLPAGVGGSPLGPRLQAAIAVMSQQFHLSRRQIPELMHVLVGRRVSPATIQAVVERASAAVEDTVEQVRAAVAASPVANADETGWKHQAGGAKRKRFWLWVASTPRAVLFQVAPDRGAAGLAGVLPPDYRGTVMVDRWRVYESVYGERRQLCWAHLAREWNAAHDRGKVMSREGPAAERGAALVAWGRAASEATEGMFRLWHRFKDGGLTRPQLRKRMARHERVFSRLLKAGLAVGDPKLATTCQDLRRQWPELWRFVEEEGVEPTNNEAERQLRPAVILRKLSAGTRSAAGMKAVGRLLTVVATCKKQGRNAVDYLADAIHRLKVGHAAPQLVYVN